MMSPQGPSRWLYLIIAICYSLPAIAVDASTPADRSLILGKELQKTLSELMEGYNPSDPISSLTRKAVITSKTNSNEASEHLMTMAYSLSEERLMASEFRSKTVGAETESRSISLSLCGLLNVLSSGVVKSSGENTTAISIGKYFVPFGFRTTSNLSRIYHVTALDVDTKAVCSPSPGADFTYRLQAEVEIKTSGLFGRTQMSTQVEKTHCAVAMEEKPASELLSSLRGSYIDVSCQQQQEGKEPARLSFVFLRESGIYLLMHHRDNWGDSTFTYESVRYAR